MQKKGSQDRRKTAEPGMEMFERFFLGRRGRPLKYETAKQDIPSLIKTHSNICIFC